MTTEQQALDRELGERLDVEPELLWQVMNADESRVYYEGSQRSVDMWLDDRGWMYTDSHTVVHKRYPAFSTDGNAMLQLLELMRQRGWYAQLNAFPAGYGAAFTRRGPYGLSNYSDAGELPHAVSPAAVKALRSEATSLECHNCGNPPHLGPCKRVEVKQ